jgi:hypothetical protein
LYRRYEELVAGPLPHQALRDRLRFLSDTMGDGLSSDLFLQVPELPPLEITRESLFAKLGTTQASVFASVAAAFQQLRTPAATADKIPLGPRRFPISTVLNEREYLVEAYTDSVLRASFLRAARHEELIYANTQAEASRAQHTRDIVFAKAQDEANAAAEILLATAGGKFPQLEVTDGSVKERLAAIGGDFLLSLALVAERIRA